MPTGDIRNLTGDWVLFGECAEGDVIKVLQFFLDRNQAFRSCLEPSCLGKVIMVEADSHAEGMFTNLPCSKAFAKSHFQGMAKHQQPLLNMSHLALRSTTPLERKENLENEILQRTAFKAEEELY